jgi:hypothetical protein
MLDLAENLAPSIEMPGKWKAPFSMANCRKSTNCLTKYYLSDIFEENLVPYEKNESDGWLL